MISSETRNPSSIGLLSRPTTWLTRSKRLTYLALAPISAVLIQVSLTGPAKAFTFNSLTPGTNPFFLDNTDSEWTISGSQPNRCPEQEPSACIIYTDTAPDEVTILSPNADASWETFKFKSGTASLPASSAYVVRFNPSILKYGDDQQEINAYYYIANGPRENLSMGQSNVITIRNGETLTFSIERGTNITTAADLTISNFSFTEVPAPLPAAGAATAFGYSRRLRRRIKAVRPAGSNKATVPSHPSVYLNLSPCKLPSLPVSFSYGSLPRPQELERHAA
jgi:hypothetical protein